MIFTYTRSWAFPFQLSRKQQSFHSSFEGYRCFDCSILPVKCWKQFHKTNTFHILWTFTSCSMLNKRTWCNFSCFWTGINSLFHFSVGWAALFGDLFIFVQCRVGKLSEYNWITVFQLLLPGQCHSVSMTGIITKKKTLILFVPACMGDLQSLFSGAYRRRFCRIFFKVFVHVLTE